MKLFTKIEPALLDSDRLEENLKMRRLIAMLVMQMGGEAKIESREIITLPRTAELAIWMDQEGNVRLRVS